MITKFYVFTYKKKDYYFKTLKDLKRYAINNGIKNKLNYKLVYNMCEIIE